MTVLQEQPRTIALRRVRPLYDLFAPGRRPQLERTATAPTAARIQLEPAARTAMNRLVASWSLCGGGQVVMLSR